MKHRRDATVRDICADVGVGLTLETGQETADDLAEMLTNLPGVYVNFDPANMMLYGKGDPVKAVKTLADRACQQWTDGILDLYDEWEQENPAAAQEQREGFETALDERRAEFAETYGEGRAEALRQEDTR